MEKRKKPRGAKTVLCIYTLHINLPSRGGPWTGGSAAGLAPAFGSFLLDGDRDLDEEEEEEEDEEEDEEEEDEDPRDPFRVFWRPRSEDLEEEDSCYL